MELILLAHLNFLHLSVGRLDNVAVDVEDNNVAVVYFFVLESFQHVPL